MLHTHASILHNNLTNNFHKTLSTIESIVLENYYLVSIHCEKDALHVVKSE